MTAIKWRTLAFFIEVFHIAFAVGILMLGGRWLPLQLMTLAVALTVFGQIIFLGCPFTALSTWFIRKECPEYTYTGSLTVWLYRRFGRVVGIPVFGFLLLVSFIFAL